MSPPTGSETDDFTPQQADDFVSTATADRQQPVVMFMVPWCEFCQGASNLLKTMQVEFRAIDLDSEELHRGNRARMLRQALKQRTGSGTVPQIFICGRYIGGATDLFDEYREGKLQAWLQQSGLSFEAPEDLDPSSLLPHHHFPL